MNNEEETTFILRLKEALRTDDIAQQVLVSLQPVIKSLEDAISNLSATNSALRKQVADRDEAIAKLQHRVDDLEIRCDDLEQQGRKGSIRVFGMPEKEEGPLEDKLIRLCNVNLKLQPPIVPEDIEVAHRVGRPPLQQRGDSDGDGDVQDTSSPPKPRPVLVKLSSRRTKGRIMEVCKRLKNNPYEYTVDDETHTAKIYIGDDLTKRRAKLAYQARTLRNDNLIKDTWISNCKILVKDNFNRITQVNYPHDLQKFRTG